MLFSSFYEDMHNDARSTELWGHDMRYGVSGFRGRALGRFASAALPVFHPNFQGREDPMFEVLNP
jgi:hypothetical protein